MKTILSSVILLSTLFIAAPALAEYHLVVQNQSGQKIRAECGHDGQSGKTFSIEHNHSTTMKVHTHHDESHVNCRAINLHGKTVASRQFHFSEGQSHNWTIGNKEHHH